LIFVPQDERKGPTYVGPFLFPDASDTSIGKCPKRGTNHNRVSGLAKIRTSRDKGVSYRIDCAADVPSATIDSHARG